MAYKCIFEMEIGELMSVLFGSGCVFLGAGVEAVNAAL
jgi:hypothetical protein